MVQTICSPPTPISLQAKIWYVSYRQLFSWAAISETCTCKKKIWYWGASYGVFDACKWHLTTKTSLMLNLHLCPIRTFPIIQHEYLCQPGPAPTSSYMSLFSSHLCVHFTFLSNPLKQQPGLRYLSVSVSSRRLEIPGKSTSATPYTAVTLKLLVHLKSQK